MLTRYSSRAFLALAGILSLAVGCGGGGNGKSGSGGTSTSITLEQRGAGLNDATATMSDLQKSGLSGEALHQALATHLKENPVFTDAGVSETAVWARFKDGPYMLIPTNIVPNTPPEPEDSIGKRVSKASNNLSAGSTFEIPKGSNTYLFDSIGDGGVEISRMKSLLLKKGYNVVVRDGSLAELRQIENCALFYMQAHGASPERDRFSIYTTTKFAYRKDPNNPNKIIPLPETDAETLRDINVSGLDYMLADPRVNGTVLPSEWHYSINSNFVENRLKGKFSSNSLVYMNVCNSQSELASSFRLAFLNTANAGMYMGWTKSVIGSHGGRAARALIELATGEVVNNPNLPRPIDFLSGMSVLKDIKWNVENLDFECSSVADKDKKETCEEISGSILRVDPSSNTNTGILAPSIDSATYNKDAQQIIINGAFGSDPGNSGVVTLGTSILTRSTWGPTQLVYSAAGIAPGTYNVSVTVRGHKSNLVSVVIPPSSTSPTPTPISNPTPKPTLTATPRPTVIPIPKPIRLRGSYSLHATNKNYDIEVKGTNLVYQNGVQVSGSWSSRSLFTVEYPEGTYTEEYTGIPKKSSSSIGGDYSGKKLGIIFSIDTDGVFTMKYKDGRTVSSNNSGVIHNIYLEEFYNYSGSSERPVVNYRYSGTNLFGYQGYDTELNVTLAPE